MVTEEVAHAASFSLVFFTRPLMERGVCQYFTGEGRTGVRIGE